MMVKERILLVTNESLHHKYWVVEMVKKLNVVGVINPKGKRRIAVRNMQKRDLLDATNILMTKLFYLYEEFGE